MGFAVAAKIAVTDGGLPFEEIIFGLVPAFCRYPKFGSSKERRFAVHGNSLWATNGILPLTEFLSGRATAFCRLQEFHLDKHRRSAAGGNFTLTSNGTLPFAGISL